MDFGDILDQWDNGKSSPKKKEEKKHWSEVFAPDEDDIGIKAEPEKGNFHKRNPRYKLKKDPQDTLDLHGLTAAEARTELQAFLARAKRRKLDKVLIIHGKGNNSPEGPVLPKAVRKVLEESVFVGQFGFADIRSGGRGATWAIIR